MNARKALNLYGPDLVGMEIRTMPIGGWPGGRCVVTELQPDPEAPEIVFQVRGLDGQTSSEGDREMGIFDWEVILTP